MIKLITAILVLILSSSCSSMKTGNGTNTNTPIANQKLSTSFVGEKIKLETKCAWFSFGSECQVVAIESTGTAPAFGNTVSNRKNALIRAEMKANANVAEFLQKEVTTNRVQNTIAKNLEKATDKVNSGKADDKAVEMTDKEAKDISSRENVNDSVIQLTETIKTRSSAILKGFIKIDEQVIGDQEVSVTIRWDVNSDISRKQLEKAMQ